MEGRHGDPAQPSSGNALSALLSQAAAVLAREVGRIAASVPAGVGTYPDVPLSGAGPASGKAAAGKAELQRQAYELIGNLFGGSAAALPGNLAGRSCPLTGATAPTGGFDKDLLRRQAHQLIDSLLSTFTGATGDKGAPAEDQVPLLWCAAPVQAGVEARATLRVVNEEPTASEVALYYTNFVADCGYEITSSRVNASPRRMTIAARGEAFFEIRIAVPQQAPTGIYSGLIQAMGTKYVKAVLSVQVL
jgi:hypothetical protein